MSVQGVIKYLRRHHVALLALFVALGGTAYAGNKIKTKNLAANAVTNPKLAPDAVTGPKIKDGEVGAADIGQGAVTAAKIDPAALRFIPEGGAVQQFTERFGDVPTNAGTGFIGTPGSCITAEVRLFAGLRVPDDMLPADGREIPVSGHETLFTVLGTSFGGNGTTHFGLPDLGPVTPDGLRYGICVDGIFNG